MIANNGINLKDAFFSGFSDNEEITKEEIMELTRTICELYREDKISKEAFSTTIKLVLTHFMNIKFEKKFENKNSFLHRRLNLNNK